MSGKSLRSMTVAELVRFYTSLVLGLIATLSFFSFLFLIPFCIQPAILSVLSQFDSVPVTCQLFAHHYKQGISQCGWSSCREGCTSLSPKCHQMTVNVNYLLPYEIYLLDENEINRSEINWTAKEVKFLVNTGGCGYPPWVNCTEFVLKYGNDSGSGIFPCYYSHLESGTAVAYFDWHSTVKTLALSIGIPNALFIVSVVILMRWYCCGCDRTPHAASTKSKKSLLKTPSKYIVDGDEEDEGFGGSAKSESEESVNNLKLRRQRLTFEFPDN